MGWENHRPKKWFVGFSRRILGPGFTPREPEAHPLSRHLAWPGISGSQKQKGRQINGISANTPPTEGSLIMRLDRFHRFGGPAGLALIGL